MNSLVNDRVYFTDSDKRSKPLIKFANDPPDDPDPGVVNVNMKTGFNSQVYGNTLADLISQQTKFLESFTTEWSKKMRSEIAKVKSDQTDTKCHYNHALLPGVMSGSRLLCDQVACITGFSSAIVGQFDISWGTEARVEPQSIKVLLTCDTSWDEQALQAYLSHEDSVSSLEFLQGLVERAGESDRCVDVYIDADRFATNKGVTTDTTGSQFLKTLLDGCIESKLSQGRKREACLLGCENYRLHEVGAMFQTDSKEFYVKLDQVVFPGNGGKSQKEWLTKLLSSDAATPLAEDGDFQWMHESIFAGDSVLFRSFLQHQSRLRVLFHKRERKFESQLRVDKLKATLINVWNLRAISYQQSGDSPDGLARQLTWRMALNVQDDYYLLLRLLVPYNVRREPCHRDLSGAVLPRHAIYQAQPARLTVCLLVLLHLSSPGHEFTLNETNPLWNVMQRAQILLKPGSTDNQLMCVNTNVWHILTRSLMNSEPVTFEQASFNTCSSLIEYLLSASLAGGNRTSLQSIIRQAHAHQRGARPSPSPRVDFTLPVDKCLVGIPSIPMSTTQTVYLSEPDPFELGFLLANVKINTNLQVYKTKVELPFKVLDSSSADVVVIGNKIDVLKSLVNMCSNNTDGVTGYRTVPATSTTPYGVAYGFCDLSGHFSQADELWTLLQYARKYELQIQHVDPLFDTKLHTDTSLVAYFQKEFTPKLLAFRVGVIAKVPQLYEALALSSPDVKPLHEHFYDSYYRTVVYFDIRDTYPEVTVRQYLANKHFRKDIGSAAYTDFLQRSGLMNAEQKGSSYYMEGYYGRMYNQFGNKLLPNVAFSTTLWFQGKRLNVLTVTSFELQTGKADYDHFGGKPEKLLSDALDGIFTKIIRCKKALQLKKVVLPVFGINDVEDTNKTAYTKLWAVAFNKFARQYDPAMIDVLCVDIDMMQSLKTFAPMVQKCFKEVQPDQAGAIVLKSQQSTLDQMLLVDECTPGLLPGAVDVANFYQLSSSNLAISTSLMLNPFMTLSGVVEGR